mmetsp:Transcript_68563/g.108812  ORF Transcript_68563/g.108812 Transcript_68563/m.108812 type:complete len:219 (+) Transcript_68563:98-754(+)
MQQFGFVPRAEYMKLEERLGNAEERLSQQETIIAALINKLEYNTMMQQVNQISPMRGVMSGGSGDRERSRPAKGFAKPPLPSVDLNTLPSFEEFCAVNQLDAKCIENLRSQPTEVQQFVISRGPASGTNPSAMITSRIAKCCQEFSVASSISPENMQDVTNKLEEFINANFLDENVAQTLREMPIDCHIAIMSMGPAGGTNPSAMVQARIAKWKRGKL